MGSIRNLGNGKFRLYVELGYDATGKRKRRSKVVEASGPRAATKMLSEFEEESRHKQHIQIDHMSFTGFVEKWLINYVRSELEPNTRDVYESLLPSMTKYFSRLKMKDVKTLHIVEYLLSEKEKSRGSLEKKYNVLKSIFKHAVIWDVIKNDPMEGVKKPRAPKSEITFYEEEELVLLIKLIEELEAWQKLLVKLTLVGGLRRGEVLGIAEDVIDYEKSQIKIVRSLQISKTSGLRLKGTKTENVRIVTFPEELMDELKSHHHHVLQLKKEMGNLWKGFKDAKGERVLLLFANEYGIPRRPDTVTQFWGRFMLRHKKEIKRVRFHDLRHSSASLILSDGINMKILQKRLGHASFKTTADVYSHITEKDDKKASDVFKRVL